MGSACSRGNNSGTKVEETVLHLPSYEKSPSEVVFTSFDAKYNLLQSISLSDYQLLVLNIRYSFQKTGSNSIFFDETDIDHCNVFLKNSIAGHPIYYAKTDEKINQVFIEYITKILTYMQAGAKSFAKKKVIAFNSSVIKRFFMLVVGLLFCYSEDMGKVESLFGWLSIEDKTIVKSFEVELFLYLMIFVPTFANYLTLKDLQRNYNNELPTIDFGKRTDFDQFFLPAKVEEVYNRFIEQFFDNKEKIDYNEYLRKIASSQLAWILTPTGIRSQFNI